MPIRSSFEDESPFLLDALPRLHPFADELDRMDELGEGEAREAGEVHEARDVRAGLEVGGADEAHADLEAHDGDAAWGEVEFEGEDALDASTLAQRRADVERMRRAFEAGTPAKKLADLVFAARYPGRKAIESAELRAAWHELNNHLVPVALQGGRYRGPLHGDTAAQVAVLRRAGASAVVSPLAIWPSGLWRAAAVAHAPMRPVVAIVVHTTGRSDRSQRSGYRKASIDYAIDYYLSGSIGAHYVIDLNGTIVATCDERQQRGHVGWAPNVKGQGQVSYRAIFRDPTWVAPRWWRDAWPGLRTPLDLLAGTNHPNTNTIAIELVPLPDATFTPEQYWALGQLIVDVQGRYPQTLTISQIPSKHLLGHEDFVPVSPALDPMRVDASGGRDPGAHRSTPRFSWNLVAAEVGVARSVAAAQAGVAAAQAVVRAAVGLGHELAPEARARFAAFPEAEPELDDELELDAEDGDDEREDQAAAPRAQGGCAAVPHCRECGGPLHEHGAQGEALAEGLATDEASRAWAGHEELDDQETGEDVEARQDVEDEDGAPADVAAAAGVATSLGAAAGAGLAGGLGVLAAAARHAAPTAAAAAIPSALGQVLHTKVGKAPWSYALTSDDLLWTARFLDGEAGDPTEREVVLWIMLNRFALYRKWQTFRQLLRAYSTPLQYPLKSAGAAYRHWKHCPGTKCTYVDLSAQFGSYPVYKGVTIPRGQLRSFLALQRRPWTKLSAAARRIAVAVLTGQARNLAGLATEFDDTAVYYRDQHGRSPTRAQWLTFTHAFAKKKRYLWPSDTVPYDQFHRNVLFVEARFGGETSPQVLP